MSRVDLSKYNNSWYKPGSVLRRTFWYFINSFFFASRLFPGSFAKKWLLKIFGAKIGRGLVIRGNVNIKYPWMLIVGDYCWIGEGVWIDNLATVQIGNNVCLSQGSMLLCGNHNYSKPHFDLMIGEIILEDGVWIGAKAVVGPSVTCGSHSVLTAMSMASTNLDSYCIYTGNPALKTKERKIG